jgi:hypothetical protein
MKNPFKIKPSPLESWFESLPENHRKYLESQPVWYDADLYRSMMFGIVAGFVVGIVAGAMIWGN